MVKEQPAYQESGCFSGQMKIEREEETGGGKEGLAANVEVVALL
jgi:hypothetical protein